MSRSPLLVALFVGSVLATAGCSPMETTARTRGVNDLKCPEEKLTVTNIGGTSYRVTGCNQEATYNCIQSVSNVNVGKTAGGLTQDQIACTREEQHGTESAP